VVAVNDYQRDAARARFHATVARAVSVLLWVTGFGGLAWSIYAITNLRLQLPGMSLVAWSAVLILSGFTARFLSWSFDHAAAKWERMERRQYINQILDAACQYRAEHFPEPARMEDAA
jgi:hypothetical protein